MIGAYLSLLLVKLVVLAGKAAHADKQVTQCVLECGPIAKRVEKLENEGLNLHAVHVCELALQVLGQVLANEVAIAAKLVRLASVVVQFALRVDHVGFVDAGREQLLQDHGLHFEA